ncbi:MAG: hypothetical protein DME43_15370 [Verrucomicrobia bacterium]|nr:MAG: hypothetical protein DME43_15370 [Verrucomicrobiota bacterium]
MKIFVFALLSLPMSLLGEGGLPSQPYIYVVGKAGVEKTADIVILRFDLVARAPDQVKANDEVQARAAKVFALLNDRKISQNDVIAEEIKSEAEFEQTETYPRSRGKLIGYVVTRVFTVKVRDVTAFPKLVDQLIAAANVEFTGIEAQLSKEKEIEDQLWDKAVANAREQAEKTLKQTGMKIDSVFAVSPLSFPEIQGKIFPAENERTIVTASEIPTKGERVPSEYRLAPIAVDQSVHVIYLISRAK